MHASCRVARRILLLASTGRVARIPGMSTEARVREVIAGVRAVPPARGKEYTVASRAAGAP